MHLRIDFDLIEKLLILKQSIKIALQDGTEVDNLLDIIIKRHSQRVRSDNLKGCNSINWMFHRFSKLTYRRGATLYGSCPSWSLCQFSFSSPRWSSAHASTNRLSFCGRLPPRISRLSTAKTASWF